MSHLVQYALVSFLESQKELSDLLARDPDGDVDRPAIYSAWRNRTPDIHPQLVVMEVLDRPDPDEGLSGGVYHETWNVQVWDDTPFSPRIKLMGWLVRKALHEGYFPIEGSFFKYCHMVPGGRPENYDATRRESYYSQMFHVVHAPVGG